MAGWGSFLDGLLKKLPIQDRKERIKNRIDQLEQEQKELTKGEYSAKKAVLYDDNRIELERLYRQLKNLT